MKYNFDEVVDRRSEAGSFSSKWSPDGFGGSMFQAETPPDDRLCFFIADMDFRTAPEIVEALQTVAGHGIFGYSNAPQAYYDAVIRWMRDRFSMTVTREDIYCCEGAHTAVVDAIKKLTRPGDGIIVPLPTYYYREDVRCVNRYYVGFQMKNDNGYYTFDWEAFEALCKEKQNTMVILQQPHNPTGRLWTDEEIVKIAKICRENGVIMLCDDVHMDFKRRENTVHPFINVVGPEGIVMITGLGKTFNLAGLAITNVIIQDKELREKMGHGGVNSPFSIAACIAAYTKCDEWVEQLNDYLDDCLDYVVNRIRAELPKVTVFRPEGTYILWLDFTKFGLTNEELTRRIAGNAHIALSDGAGMEPPTGTLFRRFCVTSPKSVLKEALDRLVACLQ